MYTISKLRTNIAGNITNSS